MFEGHAMSEARAKTYEGDLVGEKLGREKQRNEQSKRQTRAQDLEFYSKLIDNDNETSGAKNLEAAKKLREAEMGDNQDMDKGKKADKDQSQQDGLETDVEKKRPFSANAIKLIGFDPTTSQHGLLMEEGEEGKRRVSAIWLVRSSSCQFFMIDI